MMRYNKIRIELIEQLKDIVGESKVIFEKEKMIDYSHDEYALEDIVHYPDVVVKPQSTEAVSKIVKLCNDNNIPLTPRGGATGLCGGSVPIYGGVVLSLEDMRNIIEIDTENLTVTAEAGVMLMDFYAAVEKKGLFFPPHPGDESATIGGVIATNAGGARAVKYGVVRDFVKGIEVVLADGSIINIGGKFIKNSSGYSLLHLMIGSEGTLGIITKATFTLLSPPKVIYTLVIPFESIHDAIRTVPEILKNKILPMAVEFIEKKPIEITEKFMNKRWPYAGGKAHLMIIVDGNSDEEVMRIAETISEIAFANNALDVIIADAKSKQQEILEIRSNIYEAIKKYLLEILDITVPRAYIGKYMDEIEKVAEEFETWLPSYGHAADGNVHTHIMKARWEDGEWKEIENWQEKYSRIRDRIHDIGKKFNGIVSGEHGIGVVKKEYLKLFVDTKTIDLMRRIKKEFDPNNILNPGKIFDL